MRGMSAAAFLSRAYAEELPFIEALHESVAHESPTGVVPEGNAFVTLLHDRLHAVKPQRMRDVLLAQVYLSRAQIEAEVDPRRAASDFRLGYSYARTTQEPHVRELAERLRKSRRAARTVRPES